MQGILIRQIHSQTYVYALFFKHPLFFSFSFSFAGMQVALQVSKVSISPHFSTLGPLLLSEV